MIDSRLAFAVMEEKSWETVASFGINDDAAEPPSEIGRPYLEREDFADWDGKGIRAGRAV